MIDYMVRQVTPPRRVTSPTWGPPPPCKQALSVCLFQVRMVFEAFLSLKSIRFWRADVLHCSPRIGNYLSFQSKIHTGAVSWVAKNEDESFQERVRKPLGCYV